MTDIRQQFKTTDLVYAAFLMARGVKLLGTKQAEDNWRHEFIFEEPIEQEIIDDWLAGHSPCNAKRLLACHRHLLHQIGRVGR